MKRKYVAYLAALCLVLGLVGCGGANGNMSENQDTAKPYIAVVAKGFQHKYWQTVKKGAEQAPFL